MNFRDEVSDPMPAHCVERSLLRVTPDSCAPEDHPATMMTTSDVIRISFQATHGVGLTKLGGDCLRRLVSAPELLLNGARIWLKDQPGHRVALIESESSAVPGMWCCKATRTRSWWVRVITSFATFRSRNAFHQGRAMLLAAVTTPQPLVVISSTCQGAYHEYLLTAAVPESVSLQSWLVEPSREKTPAEFQQRCSIARCLAIQIQRLHRHRFDHRDLKPTNILLSVSADKHTVWLIDLDGVWRWPVLLPSPRRIQNLARLWAGVALTSNVTPTDALRFLLAYLPPEQRGNWKSLWRRVARLAAIKISRKPRPPGQ